MSMGASDLNEKRMRKREIRRLRNEKVQAYRQPG